MRNLFQAAILALSFCFPAPGSASPIDDARQFAAAEAAYSRDDYATALSLYAPLAAQGNVVAQVRLALMYGNGLGVPKDHVRSANWFRKAAEQGRAGAQESLGLAYLVGDGIAQDIVEAVKWFRKSAEQGYPLAQSRLGVMYLTGYGVPQDYVLAYMWCNLAASRYPSNDTVNRQLAVVNRDEAAAKMTPSQIGEAQRLTREWRLTVRTAFH